MKFSVVLEHLNETLTGFQTLKREKFDLKQVWSYATKLKTVQFSRCSFPSSLQKGDEFTNSKIWDF